MSTSWPNILSVPIYLEADSKDELIVKMLENNLFNQARYNYFSPLQQDDGKWVVWFADDIERWKKDKDGNGLDILPKLENVSGG